MRIIAGSLGGRQFESPKSFKTHPMSDRARGALFNVLGDLEGLSFLDAFAGSGAIGFEAFSRGANRVLLIDNDRAAQGVIASNIETLGLRQRVKLIKASAGAWLQTDADSAFDIVMCDPPYNDLQTNLVQRLAERVVAGGIMVLSWPHNQKLPDFGSLELLDHKEYSGATLAFYRQTQ